MAPLRMFYAHYLAWCSLSALAIGVGRSVRLWARGPLPAEYFIHSVVVNSGICMIVAALFGVPAFLVFLAGGKREGLAGALLASFSGVLAAYVPYWLLHLPYQASAYQSWSAQFAAASPLRWLAFLVALTAACAVSVSSSTSDALWRRWRWSAVALLLLACSVFGYGVWKSPSARGRKLTLETTATNRPHVFLVLVDTLRADHLQSYGYERATSPNVLALGEVSTVMTRAFSQAPWTRPSCASLLTSRYPPEIGVVSMNSPLPSDVSILPQFMKVEGYRTAGIISTLQLSPGFGFDKGFDTMDIGNSFIRWSGAERPLERLGVVDRGSYPRYNARQLTDRTIRWIEDELGSGDPLFAYLHYSDPHDPYRPPSGEDHWRDFATDRARSIDSPPDNPRAVREPVAEALREGMVARYDAEIAFFDKHFRRLVEYLKAEDLYDDALIIVTSDHGEQFGDHGKWGHTNSLFNELLHVPLIVKYPLALDQHTARTLERSVPLLDVVPTIREVLGAQWPEDEFRGESLLGGPDPEEVRAILATNEAPPLRGLIYRNYKLIQSLEPDGEVAEELLFSMQRDFAEAGRSEVSQEIDPELLSTIRETLSLLSSMTRDAGTVELDAATRQELEALGYL